MADLPKLPERILRLQKLRWNDLVRSHGLTGEHLLWHGSSLRQREAAAPSYELDFLPEPIRPITERRPAKRVFYGTDGQRVPYEEWREQQLAAWEMRQSNPEVIDSIGIAETIALAEERFGDVLGDYLTFWAKERLDSDEFRVWSEAIRDMVVREVGALWNGDWQVRWFNRACRSKVEEALVSPVEEAKARAARLEIQHLQNPHISLESLVEANGNLRLASTLEERKRTLEVAQGGSPSYREAYANFVASQTATAVPASGFRDANVASNSQPEGDVRIRDPKPGIDAEAQNARLNTESRADMSTDIPEPKILRIAGPDDCYFIIEPYADGYTWRLHNDSLSAVRRIKPNIAGVQSFHAGKQAFRERESCNAQMPPILELKSGHHSTPEIFVTFEDDNLRLGQLIRAGRLHWPGGSDPSVQVWLVLVQVTGLSQEWMFRVRIMWTDGIRAIELCEADSDGSRGESTLVPPTDQHWLGSGDLSLALRKSGGATFERIASHISPDRILITDVRTPIEARDMLIRTLPNNLRIGSIVDDPGYHPALGGIPERYEIKARRAAPIDSLESSTFWRSRRNDFETLSNSQRDVLDGDREHRRWLRGSCSYLYDNNANCDVDRGLDSAFRSRFKDIATQAGIALGCPQGEDPELFFVSCLCLDILQNFKDGGASELLLSVQDGGLFKDLVGSAAAYCSRLAAIQSEIRLSTRDPSPGRQPKSTEPPTDPGAKAILDLLQRVLDKRVIAIEAWAKEHRFGRTTVFDWKARRLARQPLTGKVSDTKGAEIEAAIRADAAELGLTTRTDSD